MSSLIRRARSIFGSASLFVSRKLTTDVVPVPLLLDGVRQPLAPLLVHPRRPPRRCRRGRPSQRWTMSFVCSSLRTGLMMYINSYMGAASAPGGVCHRGPCGIRRVCSPRAGMSPPGVRRGQGERGSLPDARRAGGEGGAKTQERRSAGAQERRSAGAQERRSAGAQERKLPSARTCVRTAVQNPERLLLSAACRPLALRLASRWRSCVRSRPCASTSPPPPPRPSAPRGRPGGGP